MASQQLESLINRLETVTSRLENLKIGGASSSGSASSGVEVAAQVSAFDDYKQQFVQPLINTCKQIGGPLDKAADLIEKGFGEVRSIVDRASKSKKPSDEVLVKQLEVLNKVLADLTNLRMDNRQSPFFNHLYALDEGLKCLQWVAVPNITVSYIKDMVNAAQFYTNKVLVEFRKKEGGETHVKFVEELKAAINELAAYAKEHHMTGLTFNAKGGDFASATSGSATQQQAQPKAESKPVEQPKKAGPPVDLLASINAKKDAAASGLKTVTDDMKTKNRTDRTSVVSDAPKPTLSKAQQANAKFQGTPKFELEKGVGEKWVVEFQNGKSDLSITDTNIKQNVYIYKNLNSVITIQGKVKGIVVDNCKKVGIIADSVVSSIEFVNCESVKLQINGEVHTVSVDKTDGFNMYLSKASLGTKLISSKSSEMNINVPSKTDEDDFTEQAVPEQFVTSYDVQKGTFSTVVNSVFM